MFDILLDTADDAYITRKWEELRNSIPAENIVGITTNPNAFYKTNDLSLQQWTSRATKLSSLLNQIRGDDRGVLHLQFPNSTLTDENFKRWIGLLDRLDLSCKVAIKIPPFKNALDIALRHSEGYQLNVTGISDAGTALFVLGHEINYASMIPGRMEEVQVDAKSHISYVMNSKLGNKKLITGSMRTLEGLKWCLEFGTLPTIGTRILDLIDPTVATQMLTWKKAAVPQTDFCPLNTETNRQLSVQFFQQMDQMGAKAYEDLSI